MAHTFRVRRWTAALAVALLVVGTAAACGDNGNNSSSTTSTTESDQVCKDADQLKTAIGDLADVDVSQNGTSSLDSAISKVKDQADALAKSVGDELKPQVDDLKSSLDTLKSTVGNVGEEGGVQSVLDALRGVVKAAGNLTDKATELCSNK
jgi:hypothetical protein